MFCHSCYKTFIEVTQISEKKGACFEFTDKANEIRIFCANGHIFTTQFKTKIVKKWCKGCKTGEREQRKDYFRRVDAEK